MDNDFEDFEPIENISQEQKVEEETKEEKSEPINLDNILPDNTEDVEPLSKDFFAERKEDEINLKPDHTYDEIEQEKDDIKQDLNSSIEPDHKFEEQKEENKKEEPINLEDLKPDNLYVNNDIVNNLEDVTTQEISTYSPYHKYLVVLPAFAFVFTFLLFAYIFNSNIKAEETNLIKIEENEKIGYIDNSGKIIIRPKYNYGTDYYSGISIVKNQNDLSAVLNGKGNLITSFGDYYYIERFSNRYIASKFTNQGFKLALLDKNLNELTKFKYDDLTYSKYNTFLFKDGDKMGILNENGKEIYSYTVDEVDDKKIDIEVSKVDSNNKKDRYAKLKINNSSTIISLSTGKEVYKYTLDDINVLPNNIFYIKNKNNDNNKYIVIKNDEIKYETLKYKSVRIDNYDSNILIANDEEENTYYINLNTKKVMNDNDNIFYTYGDGYILEKTHDFSSNKDLYTIKNANKKYGSFSDLKPVTSEFSNGLLMVYVNEDKFNFVNLNGKLINDNSYETATDFNEFGYSIVSNDGNYGVINSRGEEVVKLKYDKIEFINSTLFSNIRNNHRSDLFIFSLNKKYGIIDSNGKIIINASYDSFDYLSNNYGIIKGKYNSDNMLINIISGKDLEIKECKDTQIHENYILCDKKYYNYDGKLIYQSK